MARVQGNLRVKFLSRIFTHVHLADTSGADHHRIVDAVFNSQSYPYHNKSGNCSPGNWLHHRHPGGACDASQYRRRLSRAFTFSVPGRHFRDLRGTRIHERSTCADHSHRAGNCCRHKSAASRPHLAISFPPTKVKFLSDHDVPPLLAQGASPGKKGENGQSPVGAALPCLSLVPEVSFYPQPWP